MEQLIVADKCYDGKLVFLRIYWSMFRIQSVWLIVETICQDHIEKLKLELFFPSLRNHLVDSLAKTQHGRSSGMSIRERMWSIVIT